MSADIDPICENLRTLISRWNGGRWHAATVRLAEVISREEGVDAYRRLGRELGPSAQPTWRVVHWTVRYCTEAGGDPDLLEQRLEEFAGQWLDVRGEVPAGHLGRVVQNGEVVRPALTSLDGVTALPTTQVAFLQRAHQRVQAEIRSLHEDRDQLTRELARDREINGEQAIAVARRAREFEDTVVTLTAQLQRARESEELAAGWLQRERTELAAMEASLRRERDDALRRSDEYSRRYDELHKDARAAEGRLREQIAVLETSIGTHH